MISFLLAPIWALVWHWGAGIGVIILLLAGAYFSPFYKKWFIIAAVVVAGFLVGYGAGIIDANRLNTAKEAATNAKVDSTVNRTATPQSRGLNDPWDRRDY